MRTDNATRRNGMRSRLRNRTATGSDSDSEALEAQQQRGSGGGGGGGRWKGGGGGGNGGRSASEGSVVRERPSSLLEAGEAAMEGSSNSFLKDSGISDVVTNSPDENSAADVADNSDNSRVKFGAESRSNTAGERYASHAARVHTTDLALAPFSSLLCTIFSTYFHLGIFHKRMKFIFGRYVRMHLHHETSGPRRRQRPKTSELPGGTKPTTISVTQAVQNNLRK